MSALGTSGTFIIDGAQLAGKLDGLSILMRIVRLLPLLVCVNRSQASKSYTEDT